MTLREQLQREINSLIAEILKDFEELEEILNA